MVIYMANATSARDTQSETVSLEPVAELNYAAHRLADIAVGAISQGSDLQVWYRVDVLPKHAVFGSLYYII